MWHQIYVKILCLQWGLNSWPLVYKTNALPLSYRGTCGRPAAINTKENIDHNVRETQEKLSIYWITMDADSWRQSIEKQVLIATRICKGDNSWLCTCCFQVEIFPSSKYLEIFPNISRYFQVKSKYWPQQDWQEGQHLFVHLLFPKELNN